MATGTEVHHANAKRCESVMTLRSRGQALTALRLRKLATSAVAVGKVGHREKIMGEGYYGVSDEFIMYVIVPCLLVVVCLVKTLADKFGGSNGN